MPVMTTRSAMRPVRYHAGFAPFNTCCALPRCCSLLAAAALVASQASAADGSVHRDLQRGRIAKRQSIQSIRARFTETTTSSLLEKPLVSHGTVVAAPPSRVLMTYTDPERRIVAIDSKSLVVVWPDRREREKIDISQTQKRIDQYFTQATIGRTAIDVRDHGGARSDDSRRPIASTCARSASRSRTASSGSSSGSTARACCSCRCR